MTGVAGTFLDRRTWRHQRRPLATQLAQVKQEYDQRPVAAFTVGQSVVTPDGERREIKRRYFKTGRDGGYTYVFHVPAPGSFGPAQVHIREAVLLPLQLANVPPKPPLPPVLLALPEPEGDDLSAHIAAWVQARMWGEA